MYAHTAADRAAMGRLVELNAAQQHVMGKIEYEARNAQTLQGLQAEIKRLLAVLSITEKNINL